MLCWPSKKTYNQKIHSETSMGDNGLTPRERMEQLHFGPDKKIDRRQQSVELPGVDRVHVNPLVSDGRVISRLYEDFRTMHDGFKRGLKLANKGEGPCLGWRPAPDQPYRWITYNQVYERALNFGSGLIAKGCPAGQESFVGIYSQNRIGWFITQQACYMFSMVLVPLYDTLGPEACVHIINQASIETIVCDTPEKIVKLLDCLEKTPGLKRVIVMDKSFQDYPGLEERVSASGLELLEFREVEEIGSKDQKDLVVPGPEELCTICYTSGTTGTPKGVMTTHGNMVATVSGIGLHLGNTFEVTSADIHISYLPLAHSFEQIAQACVIGAGGSIGFFGGDVRKLVDDLGELKPTLFPVVPRLMQRIYDKTIAEVNKKGRIVKWLFNTAIKKKTKQMQNGVFRNNTFWDKPFARIRAKTGGRLRFIATGSAPMSDLLLNFTRCAFGALVVEGYGQTENTSGATLTIAQESNGGHIGAPLIPCQVKLVDVPDMDYYSSKGQGEICVKGPTVFRGYLKDPEKTAEALEDGWLHSGDIGQWLPTGALKIIDRKKNIFKLSQGEYIAPEKIENICVRHEAVLQVYVHGDSLKSCLVGIVVPDPDTFPAWASHRGFKGTLENLCQNEEIKKLLMSEIQKLCKDSGLKSFEQMKDLHLCLDPFSVENGLLTPTQKSVRSKLSQHFAEPLQLMYSKLD